MLQKPNIKKTDSEEIREIKEYLTRLTNALNRNFYSKVETGSAKRQSAQIITNNKAPGVYIGDNSNGEYKGLPEEVNRNFILLVLENENSYVYVLFSLKALKYNVYSQCVVNGNISEWKQL